MQDLGNHMDELFQKAGDHYQLKPVDSSWDVIASKIPAPTSFIAPVAAPNEKRKTGKILLLALLPLLLTGIAIIKIKSGSTFFSNSLGNKAVPAHIEKESLVAKQSENNTTETTFSNPEELLRASLKQNTATKLAINERDEISGQSKVENIITDNSTYLNQQNTTKEQPVTSISKRTDSTEASGNTADVESVAKPTITVDMRSRFYVGAVAGVNYNEVKNQGFTKPGFTGGVVAGYSANKKLAVETGLIVTNKSYASNGSYFSMKKIETSMPADTKIMSVEGTSTVLEIPLKLKYDFVDAKHLKLFATAGVTSYVILNEHNKYVTAVAGVQQNMSGTYKKASSYYAASADISAGVSFKTGKSTQLQIAPYVQLPLKGLGMGSMMIAATGIQAGFIKTIR